MKRGGFTIVELMIVIVVIGILSAIMIIAGIDVIASSRAALIEDNMRVIKTAATAYCVHCQEENEEISLTLENVLPYIGGGVTSSRLNTSGCTYSIEHYDDNEKYYVKCSLGGASAEKVREKLKARAKSLGLLKGIEDSSEYDGGGDVYMSVI